MYVILGGVSFGMTIMNSLTGWHNLGLITLFFGIGCVINIILALVSNRSALISRWLFVIEFIVMFAAFTITGEPEGFSILWSLIIPTCGITLFGKKYGTIFAVAEWFFLIFFFWTSMGNEMLQYAYTPTFKMRFPVIYLACFLVGFFFEYLRELTHRELMKARGKYENLYSRDALTGLYNRYGFDSSASAYLTGDDMTHAFAIIDVDDFKKVNDTYGHVNGDEVLKTIGCFIPQTIGKNAIASRWGGEEFSIFIDEADYAEDICRSLLEQCRAQVYHFNGEDVTVTFSIGLVKFSGATAKDISSIITQADEKLYEAKTTGKNRMVSGNYEKRD